MRVKLACGAAVIAVLALITTGCAPEAELEPAPAAPTQHSQPSETPEPTPTPVAPTCTTIIDPETITTLESEGFVLIDSHEDDLRAEQRVEARFFDYGGVDCLWGIAAGGDSMATFGYSEITAADAAETQTWLSENGYLRTDEGSDVVFNIDPAVDVMGHGDVFLFEDGAWFHANFREWIDDIRQTVG